MYRARVEGPSTSTALFIKALAAVGLEGDIIVKDDEESQRGSYWGEQYTLTCPLPRQIQDYVTGNRSFDLKYDELVTILGAR